MAFRQSSSSLMESMTPRLPSTPCRTGIATGHISRNWCVPSKYQVRCTAAIKTQQEQTIVRRSANYQPTFWTYDFIQSLSSDYVGGSYAKRGEALKEGVRMLLEEAAKDLDQLELIDTLQRLGIAYQFEDEISQAVKNIFHTNHGTRGRAKYKDLYATSLEFRLLRQHGYRVPQEVFNSFKDEEGKLKACLCEDIKGMLYFYEASYFLVEGESFLEHGRDLTARNLENYVKQQDGCRTGDYLPKLVSHALEFPLHWRVKRVEARWFIDLCEANKQITAKAFLLELAKLDFNMVQATHQDDLKHVSRWWRGTGLGEKMHFSRDRIMENFLWTAGIIFEPQYGDVRRTLGKVNALITTIDDVYDVYGTLDELHMFTDMVVRWDMSESEVARLPDYMQQCFLSLHNTVNSVAHHVLARKGLHVIPCLKKVWGDLCKSYLLEAKWYYSGYTPSFEEYLDNAWISISGPLILAHAYLLVSSLASQEDPQCFMKYYPNIVRWSSLILRLTDDLGTSQDEMKRGDVPKSIQCYMHETGASEEEARHHIRSLIFETWKKINEDQVSNTFFSKTFQEIAIDLVRTAQCMYQDGDGYGLQHNTKTKDYVISLFIQPIFLSS